MKKINSNLIVILFFIAVFMMISFATFLQPFSSYDESWNFQSIFKMYHNGTIYTDNNVIDTPLFFLFGNLIFHILQANLLTFRIYNIFIYLAKYTLLFILFKKWRTHSILTVLYLSIFLCFDYEFIPCGANYNQLALVMCLLGMLWQVSHCEKKNYHLGQGFFIFLVFFTKQTVGIYYAFGVILSELIMSGFKLPFFKNQLMKLVTFLPCFFISCMIMLLRGNLVDFINLCFGSILEFGSSNHSFHLEVISHLIFMTFVIVFSLFILIKVEKISKTVRKNILFLLCLALPLSCNMLPLINPYHVSMSFLFYYLLFVYILDSLLIQEFINSRKWFIMIAFVCFIVLTSIFSKTLYTYFSHVENYRNFDSNHPFYNAPIHKQHFNKIQDMTQYITRKTEMGTKVIVLSYEAASYMVPLNINNGEFDLLLNGNLGYHGISKTIDKIAKMQNIEFLILTNPDDCFYQEPTQIREYIMQHFEKIDEFLDYSIYINN